MRKQRASHPQNCWVYAESYSGERNLSDCRLPLAGHIGWTSGWGSDVTNWQLPEPDNFNLAVFARQPLDCPFVQNQVFYYDKRLKGWISMVSEFDKQKITDYIAWAQRQPIIAYWHYLRVHQLRTRKKLLEEDYRKEVSPHLTMNERLFQLNYYDKLKYKCDNEFIVERRIGKPRLLVLQNLPEVDFECDLED